MCVCGGGQNVKENSRPLTGSTSSKTLPSAFVVFSCLGHMKVT